MKKNRYLYLLTAALLVSTAAGTLTSRAAVGTVSYTALYEGTPVIGTDTLGGVTYSTVSYGDLINGGQPGMPFLPIDYIRFSVPYNATNFTVSTTIRMNLTHYLEHLVYPSQAPRFMCDTTPVAINLPDTAAYFPGSSYPSQMAWVADEGYLDGENHIVTVALLPFTYTHTTTTDIVVQRRRVNLQLHYTLSDSLAMYPIVRNDSLLREEGHRLTQSMVVNPTQVKAFAPQSPTSVGIESLGYVNGGIGGDGLNGGGITPVFPPIDPPTPIDTTQIGMEEQLTGDLKYPYLIVTTSELKNSVRRIAALKRQKGYNVKVVTMDEVINDSYAKNGDYVNGHYAFTDSAGKLRQYLRHAYKYSNTRFVYLVGSDIPHRNLCLGSDTISSDLYYSELNTDWSQDTVDRLDKMPELYVGRLLAKGSQQISNYTDKLFIYELNPGNGDYSYLKSILYTMGYQFYSNFNDTRLITSELNRIFTEQESICENSINTILSGTDIIREINTNKYAFVSLHYHGFPAGLLVHDFRITNDYCPRFLWAIDTVHTFTGVENCDILDPTIENGLNNLNNKWYPNIGYSIACKTIPFEVIPGYENLPMNFGESFTTGKDYGGPAFIGNTYEGISNYSSYLEASFGKMLNLGYNKIGTVNGLAKQELYYPANDYYHNKAVATQNLLGDPEFEIWTDIPQEFSNIEIKRDDHSITIKGIDADSCIVGYRSNSGFPEFHIVHSDRYCLE